MPPPAVPVPAAAPAQAAAPAPVPAAAPVAPASAAQEPPAREAIVVTAAMNAAASAAAVTAAAAAARANAQGTPPAAPPERAPAQPAAPTADSRANANARLPPEPPRRPQGPPPRSGPAAPPQRTPVRLRWWLLALAVLWVVWLIANPSKRRIEAQMDKAIALAVECKSREAQSELIALRGTKATPEQLQRVQKALNDASGACTRKRQRDKAWREAKPTIESAMSSASFERARQRLRAFTKRWGEDDATRAMKDEIDARNPEHPRADEVEGRKMR